MIKQKENDLCEKIVNLAKRKQFVFQSSEIYGGVAGIYDYGPNGVEMKNNLKRLWWNYMVTQRKNIVGIDGAIITPKAVWQASGHLENFTDPLVDCKKCKRRHRPDALKDMNKCPFCGGALTEVRDFNLMMSTRLGVISDDKNEAYLRGEACQSIYLDYNNILQNSRLKIPFGICQIGKAFRNEITPRNFLFRQREFEQWDMEYFVEPKNMRSSFDFWKEERMRWYENLFNDTSKIRFRKHGEEELAHYAKVAFDIEYEMPSGWKEVEGIHWRGDWDLKRHGIYSHKKFTYKNETGEKFIPNIVETSGGVDRTFYFLLLDAYTEEIIKNVNGKEETRVLLKLHPQIAPIKAAILPLRKDPELEHIANQIYSQLSKNYNIKYDLTGSIGKRYRRQDEIGTPYAITIDFQSPKDSTVTLRHRDSMEQERVEIQKLPDTISKLLEDSFTLSPRKP